MLAYNTKSTNGFLGGIDQLSSPNLIKEGYVEGLKNGVITQGGDIAKRVGYELYYGYLPLRIKSIIHSGTQIKFVLDDTVNIGNITNSPIVVYGKLSGAQSGDFTTTAVGRYYSVAESDLKTTLPLAGSPVTVLESTHGVDTDDVLISLLQNTNQSTRDWSLFFPERVDISASDPYDVDISYVTLPEDVVAFLGISSAATVAASTFTSADYNLTPDKTFATTDVNTGTEKITITSHGLLNGDPVQFTTTSALPGGITAGTTYYIINKTANDFEISTTVGGSAVNLTSQGTGTHTLKAGTIILTSAATGLTGNNLLPQLWAYDSGATEWYRIFPEITIAASTGTMTIAMENTDTSTLVVKVTIKAASAANLASLQLGTGSPNGTSATSTISASDTFYEVAVYQSSGGTLTYMIPEAVEYSQSAAQLTVDLVYHGTASTFYIVYQAISITSKNIVVTDTGAVSTNYTDTAPQLTLWGIDHDGLYDDDSSAGGHVTHIDSYIKQTASATTKKLVAGIGGNLFSAETRASAGATYLIPTTNVNLQNTVASDINLAPAFDVTAATTNRTRGLITADNVSSNKAVISAVSYVSSGVTKYTLTLTNKAGSLATAISTSTTVPDKLTVTGMANSVHNGTFVITAVDNTNNTITVTNSSVISAIFDETGASGRAAIYTDQLTLGSTSAFLPSDEIVTGLTSATLTCSTSSSTTLVISGITSAVSLPTNFVVYGKRTSALVPVDSTTNFVVGDMCSVGTLERKCRIKYINALADLTISSITGTGSVATVTTASSHYLTAVGQKVFLSQTGKDGYNGERTVVSILTPTSFTFSATETTTVATGTMLGKTVQLDESLTYQDSLSNTAVSAVGRWIPIEAPTSSDGLVDSTYYRHFDNNDYDEQAILRSTMVADSLYLINNSDEVMKYDGTNLYQAGLFRWQPSLFTQLDTTTGSLVLSGTLATVSAALNNKFTVGVGEAAQFSEGDTIIHTNDNAIYVVQSTDDLNNMVYVTKTITGAAANGLKIASRYKYYFRLNAIDSNKNIVASAVTGAIDCVVDLTAAGQIKHRLIGFPLWGIYDYDKLELEIYRTQLGLPAPFYRVGVKDVSFIAGDGYIDFTDSVADSLLGTKDLDTVNAALKGTALGTSWSQPLRAKALTAADNRLILGNIKDYPELSIVLKAEQGVGSITAANITGKKFLFKRDTTDSGTSTSMNSRVNYQFVNSGEVTINPAVDIANTATTFTVTETAHGLLVGDWVYLFHAAAGTINSLTYAGWWQIASKTDDTFTIKGNMNTAAGAADVDRYVTATAQEDIPVWIGTDGNYNQTGFNTISEFMAMIRLCNAINCSMRMTDVALSGQTTFTPWLVANAGSEYRFGEIVIRQEKTEATTLATVLPAAITGSSYFVNGVAQAAAAEVDALTRQYPSRLLISHRNFPEMFDNPFGTEATSDSIADINPADGQEITAVIPFFGDAAFGSGLVESTLAVFKTNSIYLYDINTKQKVKLESYGQGCDAPYSVTSTKDGINFASISGIYKIRKDQKIVPIGKYIKRLYDAVNKDQIAKFTGHNFKDGEQYKLSVATPSTQETNNELLVYEYQLEDVNGLEYAPWVQATNYPATGWANLDNNEFFCTINGKVYKTRNVGDSSDYRDDGAAVAEEEILLKAESFGALGDRKSVTGLIHHFHLPITSLSGTTIAVAENLDSAFTDLASFTITRDSNTKVKTVRSSVPKHKLTHIQVRYRNSTINVDQVLAGTDYNVALLTNKGIPEKSESS